MIGSVSQSENAPKITLSDFTEPEELLDKELDTRVIGMCAGITKLLCPLSSELEGSQLTWPILQLLPDWRGWETASYRDTIVFLNLSATSGHMKEAKIFFSLKSRPR